jgi:hypothetical protein
MKRKKNRASCFRNILLFNSYWYFASQNNSYFLTGSYRVTVTLWTLTLRWLYSSEPRFTCALLPTPPFFNEGKYMRLLRLIPYWIECYRRGHRTRGPRAGRNAHIKRMYRTVYTYKLDTHSKSCSVTLPTVVHFN